MADDQNQTQETVDDPEEVALAAMQGMLAAGADPQVAAGQAWLAAVPAYYKARAQWVDMMQKMHAMQQGG